MKVLKKLKITESHLNDISAAIEIAWCDASPKAKRSYHAALKALDRLEKYLKTTDLEESK